MTPSTRRKIAWLSPLPPAHTDIADYTERLAPVLAQTFDIVFVHPPDQSRPSLPGRARCLPLVERNVERLITEQRFAIYHVGNNARFHRAIVALAARVPGLLVAHDARLQDLFVSMLQSLPEWPANYRALMRDMYGEEGLNAAQKVISAAVAPHEISEQFPLIEKAAHNALAVLTHNPRLTDAIRAATARPVIFLPLPYPAPPGGPPRAGARAATLELVQFGFLGGNRCLSQILQALARCRDFGRFRLSIFGTIDREPAVEKEIAALGLAEIVKMRGFVAREVLNAALSAADLVFNLRWPSMGEASGSQLRIFAQGAPSVVVDTDWYATLPDQTVLKVPPDNIVDELCGILKSLADGCDYRARIGANGYRHLVEHHDPARYVADLDRLLGEASRWATYWAVLRTGEAGIDHWRAAGISVPGYPRLLAQRLSGLVDPPPT